MESIAAQSCGFIETLVIDNYSQDGTDVVAKSYPVRFIRFQGSAAAARNIGIKKSKGRFILLLDADQALQEGFIKHCIDVLSCSPIDGLIVPEVSVGSGFWTRVLGFEKNLVSNDVSAAIPRFFRADVLVELGEDENLVFGEDWDLYMRFRRRGFTAEGVGAYLLHYESGSLIRILVKSLQYGLSFRRLARKRGAAIYRRYTFLPVSRRRFARCFIDDPPHGAGFILLRFLRGVFFGIGVSVSFVTGKKGD
ncbi:MAG: glycosyltransferase [Thaumarchaeota archaeon]|nr:glycosyltransferase [Nitrososphaerota archaeon]MCL5318540.1 glycosyltransferase [Nitrososphaerota archaeon]